MINTKKLPTFGATEDGQVLVNKEMFDLCGLLEKIIIGRDAQKALDSVSIPERGSLVVLPAWSWQQPMINVGRKSWSQKGDMMLPVRVAWVGGSVAVIGEGESSPATYSLCGLGNTGEGVVSLSNDSEGAKVLRSADKVDGQKLPSDFAATNGTKNSITHLLKKLVEEGNDARWKLITNLDLWSVKIFGTATGAVTYEIRGDIQNPDHPDFVIVDLVVDPLRDAFVLGGEGEEESALMRLIERCLLPQTFAKVDPIKYICTSIRENAERAIRVHIDDPRTGRKVRSLSRELGVKDPDELLSIYRQRFPKERTGRELIHRALHPAHIPVSANFGGDYADNLIAGKSARGGGPVN